MKILILNWRDIKNPLGGGAEISLFEHAKYWRKKGSQITWFSSSFPGAKPKEVIDGVEIVRKGSAYTVHLWCFLYSITRQLENPDLVIDSFHGFPFLSILYMPKKKIVGLINEVAGKIWFLNTSFPIALIGCILEPVFIKLYRTRPFITGSASTKNDLIKLGLSKNKISIVHHGTHILRVSKNIKKENSPAILFLGRVSKDKGINDALEAFYEINKQFPHATLWIAGGEEKKGFLNDVLKGVDKKTRKNIVYWGFVTEKQKFELLKKAWLLLHPSSKEGWGLTVIEAASQSVPTIGYDVPGLRDSIQHKKTGILVPAGDPKSLAEAATGLLIDKERYNKLSINALQWSKKFTWDVSVKKSWEVINHVYKK